MNWLEYENKAYEMGYENICGIDEAGRGPLAGPVCAAAVILPKGVVIDGVNDSKKLTEKKREALFEVIKAEAVSYSIAFATVEEIEKYNILNATMLAMRRAVEGLDVKPGYALIDGNCMPTLPVKGECVVKGDAKSSSVACASILAKVSRDRLLYKYAAEYPQYGFDKHKGYGTKLHVEALRNFGPCPYHRMSFLGKILGDNKK